MERKQSERNVYRGGSIGISCKQEQNDETDEDREQGEGMEGDDAVSYVGPSPHPPGDERNANCQALFLDTSLLQGSGPREAMNDDFTDHRRTIAPITVVFDLPDGSQADHKFQLGQTVEVLKSYVESEFGMPMSHQELYLGSTLMMDPMSLLDYPGVDGNDDVFVTVEGDLGDEAKK